jgi:hypothetical protein
MNRRQLFLTLGLGALATTATLARRQGRSRPPRIVTTKTNAYLIGKIEPVLTGKIGEVALASEGRYALIVQDLRPEPESAPTTPTTLPPFGEQKLWLYDALRRTTKLIHRVQDNPTTQTWQVMGQLSWFPGTKRALITSSTMRDLLKDNLEIRTELGIFDAERRTIRWLSGLPSEFINPKEFGWLSGIPSEIINPNELPALSGILLTWEVDKIKTPKVRFFSLLRSDGTLSPVVKVPYEKNGPLARGVSLDGKRLFLCTTNFEKIEERYQRLEKWEVIEIASGAVTPRKEAPKASEMIANTLETKSKPLALTLTSDEARVTGQAGRSADTTALWLEATVPGPEKKFARGLVTAEGGKAHLLPDLSAVLYTRDDALYDAPIASLDRVAFEKMMRELAISNAKQTGMALMMYCQDYDENFPHDPSNIKEVILPYIKNHDVIADFVYTYKGPLELGKLDKPSETPMGYVPSLGGRAIVFGDGHVKWEPDK